MTTTVFFSLLIIQVCASTMLILYDLPGLLCYAEAMVLRCNVAVCCCASRCTVFCLQNWFTDSVRSCALKPLASYALERPCFTTIRSSRIDGPPLAHAGTPSVSDTDASSVASSFDYRMVMDPVSRYISLPVKFFCVVKTYVIQWWHAHRYRSRVDDLADGILQTPKYQSHQLPRSAGARCSDRNCDVLTLSSICAY